MRAGDALLLALLGAALAGLAADAATGGGLGAWFQANLPALGQSAGGALGWIGLVLSPLLAIPLIAGLWGRFAGLPAAIEMLLHRSALTIDSVNTAIADMARWAALALVVVTAVIVVQRYVFGLSFTRLQESVIYLHSALFLLTSAAALLNGGHVRVDIIYSKLSARARAWTDLAGTYLALMPMCWLILMTSTGYVGSAWRIMERSREGDGLPLVFLLKTMIPLFAVLMILQGASMAARAALTLAGRTAPRTPGDLAAQEL